MATPPNLIQIPFAGALNERAQVDVLDPNTYFRALINVRQSDLGALEKRLGFDQLTKSRINPNTNTTETRAAGRRLIEYNGTVSVIDGSSLDTYSEALGKFAYKSRVPECTYSYTPVPSFGTVVHDTEYCSGFVAVSSSKTYTNKSVAGIQVLDAATGNPVRPYELFSIDAGAVGVHIGLASFSGRYFAAVVTQLVSATGVITKTDSIIKAYLFDIQNAALGWSYLGVVYDGTTNALAQALPSVCSMGDRFGVVFARANGANWLLNVKTFDVSGSIDSWSVNLGYSPKLLDVDGGYVPYGNKLWVLYENNGSLYAYALTTPTLSVSSGAIFIGTPSGGLSKDSYARICADKSTSNYARVLYTPHIGGINFVTATAVGIAIPPAVGSATTVTSSIPGVLPMGRPFYQNGRFYVSCYASLLLGTLNDRKTHVVADWTDDISATSPGYMLPAANLFPGTSTLVFLSNPRSCKWSPSPDYGGTSLIGCVTRVVRANQNNSDQSIASANLVTLSFNSLDKWQSAQFSNLSYVSGGVLGVYDGEKFTESNFINAPPTPLVSQTAGSSGSGATIGYRYVAVYEDVDASGHWVVSGISNPSNLILPTTTNKVVVTTAPPSLSWRTPKTGPNGKYALRTSFYRTTDGGEAPYYYLGSVEYDPSNVSVQYEDTFTGPSIVTAGKLYAPNLSSTPGESLDRRAPPGLTSVVAYNGFLVGSAGESLFWSGQEVYGEAPWFSPVFELPITGGGPITGLAVQDGTLYVFKRSKVYAVTGEPPSDNGASGGLSPARLLCSNVGCTQPRSIVTTSLGTFFRSERGIELLDRSGASQTIGVNIQATLESYPVVTSAVLDVRNGLVRFSLSASQSGGSVLGASGRDVVFDLNLNQWQSVDVKTGAYASEPSQDATYCNVGGLWRYTWLGADGTVYFERNEATDANAFLDGSALNWVSMTVETGKFKAAGIQGQQQLSNCVFFAKKNTISDLSLSLSYNYASAYNAAQTWTSTTIDTLLSSGWPVVQLKHQPHDDALCQSVSLKIQDSKPASGSIGNGKGATWVALTMDITPRPGLFDVPESAG